MAGQEEQGWGTFFRVDNDSVHLLAIILDHAEGDPAVVGVLLLALPALLCRFLSRPDVGASLGAVLREGAALKGLALHAGAVKQSATAHLCRGRGCFTWLWLPGRWGGSSPPPAPSPRVTHMYLPQGEGQPGHSRQKGGWYPPRHWQRLQWQVPRRLHSFLRLFKQFSVDFLHWHALPWNSGLHSHSPQLHVPRSVRKNLSDQDATEIQVTLPLLILEEHHPSCNLHATFHEMVKEVLQAGAVGPRIRQTHPLVFWQGKAASPRGFNLSKQCPGREPIVQMHHLCHRRQSHCKTRSSRCRTRSRGRRSSCRARRWHGRCTPRTRSPPAPSR